MSTRLEVNPYQYTDTVSTSRISKSDPETPIVAFGPVVFEDFWHAYNFRLRRSRKIGACIVFVCVAALALLTREQFLSQGLPMLATLVVMTVGLFLSSKASVRKAYAASGKVRRWVFTKSGLQYELEEGETAFFTWKLIAHAEHSDRVLIVTTATNQLLLVPRAAFDDDSEWQQALDWLDEYRQTGANGEPQDAPFSLAKKKEDIGTDAILVKGPMNDAECKALIDVISKQQGFLSRNVLLLLPLLLCVSPLFGLLAGNGLSGIFAILSQPFYWTALPIVLVFLWLHHSIRSYQRKAAAEFEGWLLHDHGMSIVRNTQFVELEWKAILNPRVLEEGLLVEIPGGVHLVPRSGFLDESDWQRACALVRAKVQGNIQRNNLPNGPRST